MVHSTSSIEGRKESRDVTILLVESDEDEVFVEELVSKHRGYRVLSASDLNSALNAAGTGKVDILISELELPDGKGESLIQAFRRRQGRVFAISVGGFGDAKRSADAGFNAHMSKPLEAKEVARLIEWVG